MRGVPHVPAREPSRAVGRRPGAGPPMVAAGGRPEDALDFYSPVINWINEYSKNPNEKTLHSTKYR